MAPLWMLLVYFMHSYFYFVFKKGRAGLAFKVSKYVECWAFSIDRFQSRGQQLCKLLGLKENSIPTGFFLYTNMAADSSFCTLIYMAAWRHVKTVYKIVRVGVSPKCRSSPKNEIDGIFRFTPPKSGKSALGMRLTGEYPSGHVTGCATGSCWPLMLRSFSTRLYTHNEIQAKYFSNQIRG